MRKALIAVAILFLCGCSHALPVVPQIVSACPEPQQISRPQLPLALLTEEKLRGLSQSEREAAVYKSSLVSMAILMGYVKDLENIVAGYRKPPVQQPMQP